MKTKPAPMKMHLLRKGRARCGQFAKRKLRTTNVTKMETCRKCKKLAGRTPR